MLKLARDARVPQNLPGILWEAWEQEREAFILLHEPNECTVHFFRFWSFKMSPLSEESFFFFRISHSACNSFWNATHI